MTDLRDLSIEDRVDLLVAQQLAEAMFYKMERRDGQPLVRHSRALALKARELGLGVYAQILGWAHDLVEDCNISLEEVGMNFTGKNSSKIIFGLNALTHRSDEPVEDYFERITEASKVYWEIVVVKLIDRWHFHLCPYGGKREKEMAKATETLTSFRSMCEECRAFIPEHFLTTYDELFGEVVQLAEAKLIELGVELP